MRTVAIHAHVSPVGFPHCKKDNCVIILSFCKWLSISNCTCMFCQHLGCSQLPVELEVILVASSSYDITIAARGYEQKNIQALVYGMPLPYQ
ncbi:hypothetical protein VNO77_24922 [Canavalia gladiata]|uniref:Uncharacterized protein n=1 Tax=Canavalia gladiata TaxID=3824 RepID=A0AAN9QD59_CANGL